MTLGSSDCRALGPDVPSQIPQWRIALSQNLIPLEPDQNFPAAGASSLTQRPLGHQKVNRPRQRWLGLHTSKLRKRNSRIIAWSVFGECVLHTSKPWCTCTDSYRREELVQATGTKHLVKEALKRSPADSEFIKIAGNSNSDISLRVIMEIFSTNFRTICDKAVSFLMSMVKRSSIAPMCRLLWGPENRNAYTLVGECYVHDILHGGAVQLLSDAGSRLKEMWIELGVL